MIMEFCRGFLIITFCASGKEKEKSLRLATNIDL